MNTFEEDVRKVFSNGDAAFALNWTYMYNMANDPKQSKVAGDVGIVPAQAIPRINPALSTVQWDWASPKPVSIRKRRQYIHYLTSQPVQDKYAKLSLPVWKARTGILPLPKAGEPDRRRRQVVERDALAPKRQITRACQTPCNSSFNRYCGVKPRPTSPSRRSTPARPVCVKEA